MLLEIGTTYSMNLQGTRYSLKLQKSRGHLYYKITSKGVFKKGGRCQNAIPFLGDFALINITREGGELVKVTN